MSGRGGNHVVVGDDGGVNDGACDGGGFADELAAYSGLGKKELRVKDV